VIRVYVVTQGVPPANTSSILRRTRFRYVVDPGIGGAFAIPRPRAEAPRFAKATLMALITDGILTHKLPWGLVLIGVFLTIAIELMGVSSLPVAVGVYLPITTSRGCSRVHRAWLVERRVRSANRSLAEIESVRRVVRERFDRGRRHLWHRGRGDRGWGSRAARQPTGSPKHCRCITTLAGSRRQPSLV